MAGRLVALARARLEAEGWVVEEAPPSIRQQTGIVLMGHRAWFARPVYRCPECEGEVEPAVFDLRDRGMQSFAHGWACPACGWMGFDKDLPQERGVRWQNWSQEELARILVRRPSRPPSSSGDEEERKRRAYSRRLEEITAEVRAAQPGTRNVVLARAASVLGYLAAKYGGSLEEAEGRLLEAAADAGLPEREARDVIRRQLRWGYSRG